MLKTILGLFAKREIDVRSEAREDRELAALARERREALIRGETVAIPADRFFEELEREHPAPA